MNPIFLAILEVVSKDDSIKPKEIAKKLGLAKRAVTRGIKILKESGYLLQDKQKYYYVTFLGKTELSKFDMEKAMEAIKNIKNAIKTICEHLDTKPKHIKNMRLLGKGMTNTSYKFSVKGKNYIYRVAGEGSEMLVDRYREYNNYLAIQDKKISEKVIYHSPITGIKISRFIEGNQEIDISNQKHLKKAVEAIRHLHNLDIQSPHYFDFNMRIDYYQMICDNVQVEFLEGYEEKKELIFYLLERIKTLEFSTCFCHIDFVPSNCLLVKDKVILIDWEYSGEQDPLVDIAMFCISANFTKAKADNFLKLYLERVPTKEEQFRFYTYIATAALMWSLWSEYKTALGEVFEGYTSRVYKMCDKYSQLAYSLSKDL